MIFLLSLLACRTDIAPEEEILPSCGNGIVEPDEQCDDGTANSDSQADACRTSCREPVCGDMVTDGKEQCDDGNGWGGDGCDQDCVTEEGVFESEPNDAWDAAQAITGGNIGGSLTGGDIDCFSFAVEECHTVAAQILEDCEVPVHLALHDPSGTFVAASGYGASGCAVIDPVEEPGARFAEEGTWAVCVTALQAQEVPSYSLELISGPSEDFELPLSESTDFDGDGLIDECDGDRDGDGLDNNEDNCPDIPNGPTNISPTVDSSGFIRHWLAVGPFTGENSASDCLPTDVERLGVDAEAVPELGQSVEGLPWRIFMSESAHVNFVPDYTTVDAPREIYGATWVYSAEERALTLGLGPDDGARAWLNGDVVLEVSGCQGVVVDKFTADVTLLAGWNSLILKIYDQGGGWGTYARFLDENGPVVDLELSLSAGGAWGFDQTDSDGDGIGDICDED
jgi:cysteine-rich repeat protein